MKHNTYNLALLLLLSSLSFFIGCNPTYQSIRAYVPQHTKGQQLQAELGPSQADVSYSFTDNLQVNAGGIYLSRESNESGTDIMGNEVENVESSKLMGAQLGLGYFNALGKDRNHVVSVNVGSAFQSWTFNRTNTELVGNTGFDSFDASIINPHAQIAYSHGDQTSNILFGIRYEKPMFDFQNLQPTTATDESNPALVNFLLQSKIEISKSFSLFGQFIYRENLDTEYFDSDTTYNEYSISSWNVYVGLGYSTDFAQ